MKDQEYKRTFTFGKVAYTGKSKSYLVDLEVELKIEDNKPIFSASGDIWNTSHTDILMGGQCIDDIYSEFKGQILNRKTFESIMGLWERNHLNDTHPDCEHQEKLKWTSLLIDDSKPYSQDNARAWTTYEKGGRGLLGKPCPKCGYKYGTAWKYRGITKNDLQDICYLLKIDYMEAHQIIKLGI